MQLRHSTVLEHAAADVKLIKTKLQCNLSFCIYSFYLLHIQQTQKDPLKIVGDAYDTVIN